MNIRIGELSGSDDTHELHGRIREFNQQSMKQADEIIHPTRTILWLTVAVLLAAVGQVLAALTPIFVGP